MAKRNMIKTFNFNNRFFTKPLMDILNIFKSCSGNINHNLIQSPPLPKIVESLAKTQNESTSNLIENISVLEVKNSNQVKKEKDFTFNWKGKDITIEY